MTLRELEATFLKHVDDTHMRQLDDLAEADGVMFLCPTCFATNAGPVGTHQVICWFVGKVGDHLDPKPGRWTPVGSGIDDLTFVPSEGRSQSVLLTSGCKAHFLVVNGAINGC